MATNGNGRWKIALTVGVMLAFTGGVYQFSGMLVSRADLAQVREEALREWAAMQTDLGRVQDEQAKRSVVVYGLPSRLDALEKRLEAIDRRLDRIEELLRGRRSGGN